MPTETKILTLRDLLEAAGGDQDGSVLEVYDEQWNLYRVVEVTPDVLDDDSSEVLLGEDELEDRFVPCVQIRLELVRRNWLRY